MFSVLDDSPMFRKQVAGLEDSADNLRERCQKFHKSCRKYSEGLEESLKGEIAFASAMEAFGGNADDPIGVAVGGPVMGQFYAALREIGSYKEMLRSQVEHMLIDRLHNTTAIDLQGLKDLRKRFDKASQTYDQVREKYLGLRKDTKADVAAELEKDLRTAKSQFEVARFHLLSTLTSIEAKKKFEFLEALSSTMDAHLRYYKQGYEVLKGLEPYIHQVLTFAHQKRERAVCQQRELAERMEDHRRQSERESSSVGGEEEGGGPFQIGAGLNSHKSIEVAMTGRGKVRALKQGYLLKRSSNLRGDWKRRFFVLDSRGLLYYYRNHWPAKGMHGLHSLLHAKAPDPLSSLLTRLISRDREGGYKSDPPSHSDSNSSTPLGSPPTDSPLTGEEDGQVAHRTVDLLTSTIKMDAEQSDLRFCFRIVSPTKMYTLQAENAGERAEWMDCITGVISSLLNAHLGQSPLSLPLDPSHPRPLDVLCQVAGNRECVDCGAEGPDWASLNLGVLMCIECSGVHRHLGTHVSKVRSLTLDVKAWEQAVMAHFQATGNTVGNSVWEEGLEEGGGVRKPKRRDSVSVKERFIQAKYLEKQFVKRVEGGVGESRSRLWQAVEGGEVGAAVRLMLTSEADVHTTFEQTQEGEKRGEGEGEGGGEGEAERMDRRGWSLLHLACSLGYLGGVEMLLQHGAEVEGSDRRGRSPLHIALLFEAVSVAKLLLSRGAKAGVRDLRGRSALDAAVEAGVVADEDLFLMLAEV